jgi:hypothetical protein
MRLVLDAGGVSIVVNELGVLRDRRCLTAGKASAAAFFRSIHTSASKPNQRSTAEPTGSRWPTSPMRWGLMHTGRFAAAYRRTYGESPSETLRGHRVIPK